MLVEILDKDNERILKFAVVSLKMIHHEVKVCKNQMASCKKKMKKMFPERENCIMKNQWT